MTATASASDLSAYGLTKAADGVGLDFDASGIVEAHMPNFVSALEDASAKVTGAGAAIVGGIDAAAEVATYIAPEIAADLSAASAEATALGVSSISGPLAPVLLAVIAIVAYVESNLASGGTGCCGVREFTRDEAIAQLRFEHWGPAGAIPGTNIYALAQKWQPSEDAIVKRRLYSGWRSTAAPCDPKQYQWDTVWGGSGPRINRDDGSPEAFVEGVMRAVWEARDGCWTDGEKLVAAMPGVMAAASRAWNNRHLGTSKRTIVLDPFAPWTNPLYVAARQLRTMSKQPNASIHLTLNTGPAIPAALAKLGKLALPKLTTRPPTKGSTMFLEPLKMKTSTAIAPIAMRVGLTPPKPAPAPAAAPGATILGLPAKDVGIGALVVGAGVAAWKFLLK